jgi:hypothetical protein
MPCRACRAPTSPKNAVIRLVAVPVPALFCETSLGSAWSSTCIRLGARSLCKAEGRRCFTRRLSGMRIQQTAQNLFERRCGGLPWELGQRVEPELGGQSLATMANLPAMLTWLGFHHQIIVGRAGGLQDTFLVGGAGEVLIGACQRGLERLLGLGGAGVG